VRSKLAEHGLEGFEGGLVDLGVNVLDDVQYVSVAELRDMGMSVVQIRKFEDIQKRCKRQTYSGHGDAASLSSRERRRRSSLTSFNLKKSFFSKKKTPSYADDDSSLGESASTASSASKMSKRKSTSTMRVRESGGGYNDGGYIDGRELAIDNTFGLSIPGISRVPVWDSNQSQLGFSNVMAVLQMAKGVRNIVTWKESTLVVGSCNENASRGSRYFVSMVERDSPITKQVVQVPAVKAVAQIRVNYRQIMSVLLAHKSNLFVERMGVVDGTLVSGQVLRVCSPRSEDGHTDTYEFPGTPLCTVKRTCHSLPGSKDKHDFVFQDYSCFCKNSNDVEVGVHSMASIELPEVSPQKGVTRGMIYEGSGFVITPLSESVSELTYVLVGGLDGSGGSPKNKRMSLILGGKNDAAFNQLEAMVSVVDGIRVWLENQLKRFGSLENAPEPIPFASVGESTAHVVSKIPSKANRMMYGDEETPVSPSHAAAASSGLAVEVEDEDFEPVQLDTLEPKVVNDELAALSTAYALGGGRQDSPPRQDDLESIGSSISRASTPPPANKEEALLKMEAELNRMRAELKEREAREAALVQRETEMARELRERRAKSKMYKGMDHAKFEQMRQEELEKREAMKMDKIGEEEDEDSPREEEGGGGEEKPSLESEIERLRRLLTKFREFLPKDVNEEDLDVTLEDAETKMKAAVQVLMNSENPMEQAKAQQDFDKWDRIVQNHPDFKERQRLEWEKWEDDNRPKNKAAFEEMQSIIKEEYFSMSPVTLANAGLTKALVKRIAQKKVFQLYYKTKLEIQKLHHVALMTGYSAQGLDIVEMRALYYCIPEEFSNDPEGKKRTWRANIKTKLAELIKKEDNGQLRGEEKRSRAYNKDADKPKAAPKFGGGVRTGGARPPMNAALAGMLAGRGRGPPAAGKKADMAAMLGSAFAARGPPRGPRGPPGDGKKADMASMLGSAFAARGPPRGPRGPPGDGKKADMASMLGAAFAARGPPPPEKKQDMGAMLSSAFAARGQPKQVSVEKSKHASVEKPKHVSVEKPKVQVEDSDLLKSLESDFGAKTAENKKSVKLESTNSGLDSIKSTTSRRESVKSTTSRRSRTPSEMDEDLFKNLQQAFNDDKSPPTLPEKPSSLTQTSTNKRVSSSKLEDADLLNHLKKSFEPEKKQVVAPKKEVVAPKKEVVAPKEAAPKKEAVPKKQAQDKEDDLSALLAKSFGDSDVKRTNSRVSTTSSIDRSSSSSSVKKGTEDKKNKGKDWESSLMSSLSSAFEK